MKLDTKRTALVLIDLQNGILSRETQPYTVQDVVERSRKLADAFRARSALVVYVYVLIPDMLELTSEVPTSMDRSAPASASEIAVAAGMVDGDILIAKRHWGAFAQTGLEEQLRNRHITTVVLAGIATNMGVESTLRQGTGLGFEFVTVEDACSTFTAEMQEFAFTKIFHAFPSCAPRSRSSKQSGSRDATWINAGKLQNALAQCRIPFYAEPMLHDMFHLPVPVLEKVLRPFIVYFCLILFLRFFGKRELAQLNPFDLVVLLCLSNTVQNAMIGDDNSLSGGLIGAFALLTANWLLNRFLYRTPKLNRALQGTETVLVRDGMVDDAAMRREMLTREELIGVLHKQNVRGLSDVKECTLEPNGTFYIVSPEDSFPRTRHEELMARLDEMMREIQHMKTAGGR